MRCFEDIVTLAIEHKGSVDAYMHALAETKPLSESEISSITDDRVLAAMTRRVFYAGFSSKVVDAKWGAFEQAFEGFNPRRCASMTDERLEGLLERRDLVRDAAKIRSVPGNGAFVIELTEEHGSAGRFFAEWPDADYVGLLDFIKKRASRLSGETGMRFLRSIGKPAFIPTPDVVKALIREKILYRRPSGKGDLATMQAAFNGWSDESGLDLTSISRTLAMSVV